MKIFLKILNVFFVFLGVIFFLIIVALSYLWIADPFNIKPMFMTTEDSIGNEYEDSANIDAHPLLNDSQESMLKSAGINPASLPREITPELEACVVDKIGEARTREIVAGATPSVSEVIQAQTCLKK
ncbi:MAG TPA: hypothetical protein VFD51_03750 [Patescibacteria group bacterium]|nr:hypothetical protein [Patescibacteria group bacterium]